MSHTSRIATVPLKSVTAIMAAVAALQAQGIDCNLQANIAPRMYQDNGNRGHQFRKDVQGLTGRKVDVADYCINLPSGQYDVGLVWNETTLQYDAIFDSWAGNVSRFLGSKDKTKKVAGMSATSADIGLFLQEYSKAQVYEWAEENNYVVEDIHVDEQYQCHITCSEVSYG